MRHTKENNRSEENIEQDKQILQLFNDLDPDYTVSFQLEKDF